MLLTILELQHSHHHTVSISYIQLFTALFSSKQPPDSQIHPVSYCRLERSALQWLNISGRATLYQAQ